MILCFYWCKVPSVNLWMICHACLHGLPLPHWWLWHLVPGIFLMRLTVMHIISDTAVDCLSVKSAVFSFVLFAISTLYYHGRVYQSSFSSFRWKSIKTLRLNWLSIISELGSFCWEIILSETTCFTWLVLTQAEVQLIKCITFSDRLKYDLTCSRWVFFFFFFYFEIQFNFRFVRDWHQFPL